MTTAVKPTKAEISLFGFQAGPEGFVHYGTDLGETGSWTDYLFALAHGGRGSGKTRAGAIRTVRYLLSHPNCLGIVTAPTLWMLGDSTRPAIEETLRQLGLKRGSGYTYTADREELAIDLNGSKILLRSTEHPDRLRGQTAAFFWMDEPRDSPLEAFMNLQGTLRQSGYPHQGWLTTTPAGRYHWTCKIFHPEVALYSPGEPILRDPTIEGIGEFHSWSAHTRDNPFGGMELYLSMIATYGVQSTYARQELFGDFVLSEGLVYDVWLREKYAIPRADWPIVGNPKRVVAGVDFGFTNPSAILVEGLDDAGRRYILDEWYARQQSEEDLVREGRRLMKKYGIHYFFADSEDPRWIEAMRRGGLPVSKAYKRRGSTTNPSSGIGLCYRVLIKKPPAGVTGQMFYVDPVRCPNFCREIEGYVHNKPLPNRNAMEMPRRLDQHSLDAWRYSETGIIRLGWDSLAAPRSQPRSVKMILE